MSSTGVFSEGRDTLGESPLWSPAEQALYWIDTYAHSIYRLGWQDGLRTSWNVGEQIGAIGLMQARRLVLSLRSGFYSFDIATGAKTKLASPEADRPRIRLNDGKVDRAGRYWSGSLQEDRYEPVGTLWRLDVDHSTARMVENINIPNAICWSPDSTLMYFADSLTRRIEVFDFDIDSGSISGRRLFVSLEEGRGVPDGATVDADGCIWNACMDGGRVTCFAPDGRLEQVIELPVSRVTSCAFGGPNLDTLFVTSAIKRLTDTQLADQPLAGSVFALETGHKGIPEPEYLG